MTQAKFILILVIALLTIIIVLQNSQPVETKILFFTLTMPRSLLLFLAALAGFIMGGLVCLTIKKGDKKRDRSHKV